ncbi:L-lactate permease [Escherichia coli]
MLVGWGRLCWISSLPLTIGPELPDITSALVSIVSLALFLKVWRPKNTETAISMGQSAGAMVVNKPSSAFLCLQ